MTVSWFSVSYRNIYVSTAEAADGPTVGKECREPRLAVVACKDGEMAIVETTPRHHGIQNTSLERAQCLSLPVKDQPDSSQIGRNHEFCSRQLRISQDGLVRKELSTSIAHVTSMTTPTGFLEIISQVVRLDATNENTYLLSNLHSLLDQFRGSRFGLLVHTISVQAYS